ncbi:type B DNA-directed DNA polymerase [Natronobiforma cellulositropha]|uniref:type B DNA-directed DNA polymerase n=1 Tax=Natronobiforma cellulositropha TaxID=1679076 RepID=UPI0021D5FEAA|nr:type B DNA-directed DNA polymerase [Natronobiforma cellulositropha]
MAYAFDFEEDLVRVWNLSADGATYEERTDYRPSLFVDAPERPLERLSARLERDPKVSETGFEIRYTTLRDMKCDEPTRVLRVSFERVSEGRTLTREIRGVHARELACAPGTVRLFNVGFAPGFRYCLDEGVDPTPSSVRDLRVLRIGIDERALAAGDVSALAVDGEAVRGDPADVCWSLGRRLERTDPDVLCLSHGDLVPALETAAAEAGIEEFHLGRLPGWQRLSRANTYTHEGRAGSAPARYHVPGRAVVDESNSFLWHQSGLEGIRYLVGRTGRPLEETAWASIGTLLTARQIRLARREGVLAPHQKWEPERFKDVGTLHAADRGGFTFTPDVGFHEDVFEIDFASLYPRIICRHNVSPETVDCACCDEGAGARVPELEYRLCERDGFLPGVLRPLLDDRAACKRALAGDPDEAEAARLRATSGAIKWVLVSSFGYQGYRNATFGRIECHEAINAIARDILLRTKAHLERAGWRIVHGIVDSLWVTPEASAPEPLEGVLETVSHDVGIELEHDGTYEWVCFLPQRTPGRRADVPRGALTRYFGKRESGEYKLRGIEARQRSTPAFVAECQREFIDVLDREREPEAVCDRLQRRLEDLRRGVVDPADLVVTKRVSKPASAYRQRTQVVAALGRYESHGLTRRPGQSVSYVVTDNGARRTRERVRLAFELESANTTGGGSGEYDVEWYSKALIRACESVVSALGWDRAAIRRYLERRETVRLSSFVE